MQPVTPRLGTITDAAGKHVNTRLKHLELKELLRLGLIAKGIIGQNNKIDLTLVGERINVTVIK